MALRNRLSWLDKEPMQIRDKFIKNNRRGGFFKTASGVLNVIDRIDDLYIYIKCKTKDSVYKIGLSNLTSAINQLYLRKSLKRSDLATYSKYNTALFGILLEIFKGKIALKKDEEDKRSWKMLLKGVRFIPSGMTQGSTKDWLTMKRAGVKVVMISFAALKNEDWYIWCTMFDMLVVVDSGAFTAATQGKRIDINEYADFIKKYKSRILDFMNLDVIGDAEASRRNYNILKELTGMNPIPVWHPCTDNWKKSDWKELDRMTKESDLVAIGGTNKSFLKDDSGDIKRALFKKIKKLHPYHQFHLLGHSSRIILDDLFTLGQADSTSWTGTRKEGKNKTRKKRIYSFNGHSASQVAPDSFSKVDCVLYSIQRLTSFEQFYGDMPPTLCPHVWKILYKNTDKIIEDLVPYFRELKIELRRRYRNGEPVEFINSDPLDKQLMFNF